MTLHIFNPEHDIALANGMRLVTPPHAARQLKHDLGFIPAFWANEGDVVLVDDAGHAERAYQRVRPIIAKHFMKILPDVIFSEYADVKNIMVNHIDPWGWDYSLYAKLLNEGVCNEAQLPSKSVIASIMNLSHRRTSAKQLALMLTVANTTGKSVECDSLDKVYQLMAEYNGKMVVKAPWSSSGRGVRFVEHYVNDTTKRWITNTLAKQKSVMVEPYYRRVMDFGMEFNSRGDGHADYLGLSLFSTANGAYTGNVIAPEQRKREMLSRYVTADQLDKIKNIVCNTGFAALTSRYEGPFGIDMMIVAGNDGNGFMLHPCVEINLRRTMGHLALALTPDDGDMEGLMQVVFEGKFKLRIR